MWEVTYTDTFGGEANFAWVRRYKFEAPDGASNRTVARRAKAAAGLNGEPGRSSWHGDSYEFRPSGSCTVLFCTWDPIGHMRAS